MLRKWEKSCEPKPDFYSDGPPNWNCTPLTPNWKASNADRAKDRDRRPDHIAADQ